MTLKIRHATVFALVIIVVCCSVYYITIWVPAMRRSTLAENVPVVVASKGVIEIFGTSWRMRELSIPKVEPDTRGKTPLNGRTVAFLFEREFGEEKVGRAGNDYSKCSASVFDDRMREWNSWDSIRSRDIDQWMERNSYSGNCSGKVPSKDYVLVVEIPKDVQLRGVDVSFSGSGRIKLIARFTLN
ncbi:hypothetical protein [Mycobacteroides sp. LB1]|uniref:hypothetical protein n=1 Tax=Mycobacteroides sp. LB1 TaxID=2750814 RepID=UPI0015DE516E|nr:hypothetical protein [Mycobacteroides sp. LB1]